MIPLKLQLRNFMCYRAPTSLNFEGIHLACLAGDNGHGKSALLDAITWALWGKARARHDDELVTLGEKEMEVELEFLLGGVHYRVIRKRELRRQKSRGALELQIKDNGEFRSFTASTQWETQARINEILRMDYDTFINSAFLLQGRADEFTVKQPAERKRILADILGLSIYDEYERRAKALAKEKEQAVHEVEARIQEIQRELEHRTEYKRELQTAQAALTKLSSQVEAAETALQELRDKVRTLEAQRIQQEEVRQRISTTEEQLRELDEQIETQRERITACETILGRREDIEAGYARLLQAREQEAVYGTKLSQLLPLNEEKARLEKLIAEARNNLEMEKRVIEERIADLERQVKQCSELEAEHAKVSQELEELNALQTKAEGHRQHIKELSNKVSALQTLNEQLKMEMVALKEKTEMLQAQTATCPLCGQALLEDDRLRLIAEFEESGVQKAKVYRENKARLREMASRISSLESEIDLIKRKLRRMSALQGRKATLSKSIREAQQAVIKLKEQRQALALLERRLKRGDFAVEEQEQLASIEKHIADLGYDEAAHEAARQAVERLAHFDADKAELDRAQQIITDLRENEQQLMKSRKQITASLEIDRQRYTELSAELAEYSRLVQELDAKQQEVTELHNKEDRARLMVGAAQQKLAHCRFLAGERRKRKRQLKKLLEEQSLYEELQLAFGKKGLQALIIESAIPEIEDEANALLGRMTEGRMSVHFETQRDTKKGSTIETLDIKIADENGTRSYEMYSGGEAFRVNFAIRIALSKLLARRAGAQLQTLIIDEGFGTQDTQGRQRLVEAINSIKDDFARILVITHIEELKDAFPVRIDVYKTLQGSQITIN